MDHGASVSAVNNDGELAIDISESDEMEELLQKEIDKQVYAYSLIGAGYKMKSQIFWLTNDIQFISNCRASTVKIRGIQKNG